MSLRDTLPQLSPDSIARARRGPIKTRRPWLTVKDMAIEENVTPQGILHRIKAGKYEAGIFLGGIMVRRYKENSKKKKK